MRLFPHIPRLTQRKARACRNDERGSISVEFAILLPVLTTLFLATVEFSAFIWAKNSATDAAGAAGDLTTRYVSVSEETMTAVFQAAERMVDPDGGPIEGLEIIVTSLLACEDEPGADDYTFEVLWSHRWTNGTLRDGYAQSSNFTQVPDALGPPSGGTMVYTEVNYDYAPPIGFVLGQETIALNSTVTFRPRKSREVVHTGEFAVNQANSCG